MVTSTVPVPALPVSHTARPQALTDGYFSRMAAAPQVSWNLITGSAFSSLIVLWAVWMHATWAAWGNLTIDSGHEMYVPAMLSEGKMLYRDIWFMYPPAAPYFNSYLFRLLGLHLNVLYWAGSLSALGSAIFLYLAGMRLSSWLAGWAAGAVVLLQAFQPSLFCFPLPYSFSPVYGCLIACLFVWLVANAATSEGWAWMLSAGLAAAAALLLKLEFGAACYATLALLIAARGLRQWSWKLSARDLATTLPGIAICGLVIRWMVSIAGADFITQENFMSWPTSYFMKTYGKMWLESTGFALTGSALRDAMFRSFLPAGVILAVYCTFGWKRTDLRSILLRAGILLMLLIILAYYVVLSSVPLSGIFSALFFPRDMVLYVAIAALAAWWYFWRHSVDGNAAIPLLMTFSSLLAFRILLLTVPWGYSIYYDGPAVLAFLLLVCAAIPGLARSRRAIFLVEMGICLACVTVAGLQARKAEVLAAGYAPLVTGRGTVRAPKQQVENYKVAIQFMKEKAALGDSVLSIPEDTSLYFLSGTRSSTRYYLFAPGVMVPGKMTDDLIRELDRNPPRYLLWSNRTFANFGVRVFGTNFDRILGDYFRSRYRRVGPLTPYDHFYFDWNADIWERKPEAEAGK